MTRKKQGMTALAIGAMGVVFGDIGTSPLYAIHVLFGANGLGFAMNAQNVYGIISLVLWSVTIVVSIKYISFIMRVNNKGEGGIMALVGLIKASQMKDKYKAALILIGLIGVSFFYGDSVITPAISVLSAVEGLKVVAPQLDQAIIPATLVILTLLFWLQRRGTSVIGHLFGPVMLVWFATIAAGGAWQIWQHPGVLIALSPITALQFFTANPLLSFAAMGAVVLAITGAEALYADMGHFGRAPIARAWFFAVFPSLLLCYMGQGALLLHNPAAIANPLVLLFPSQLHVSVIILATAATLIASQSVISGAFSLTYQATQLDFLPRMLVKHTSVQSTGQIYLPFINLLLFIAVFLLVLIFGSSQALASAFGIAVSGTLAIDTILFAAVISLGGRRMVPAVITALIIFLPLDLLFFAGNIPKILHGGWFPISLAALVFIVLTTWVKGQRFVVRRRHEMEGPLSEFIDEVNHKKPPVIRLPGQAVYISHHPDYTPLALRAAINELDELHEKVVIVSVRVTNEAHVPVTDRARFDPLDNHNDGISHVILKYGFHDAINIPHALQLIRGVSPELDFDPDKASYFVSQSKVVTGGHYPMARWRKALYAVMARNGLSSSDFYKLPFNRTVEMRSLINL